MANRSYMAENRELAYRIWRECGQNAELTLRKLKAHEQGFPLSKPTLYEWMEAYTWKDRAARAEAEERRIADAVQNAEARAIASLEKVQEQCEAYLRSLGPAKVDSQVLFAYVNVVKSVAGMKAKAGEQKAALFLDFMKDLIGWLSKNNPAGMAVIEGSFDDFVTWAREKYGN